MDKQLPYPSHPGGLILIKTPNIETAQIMTNLCLNIKEFRRAWQIQFICQCLQVFYWRLYIYMQLMEIYGRKP